MKKFLLGMFCLLMVTGCGKEENKFEKYEENNEQVINDIKSIEVAEGTKEFENMMVLNNDTLRSFFGITSEDVENYVAQVSYQLDSKMYLAFKPEDGKEDKIKKLVELYINSIKSRLEMQKDNVQAIVAMNDTDGVMAASADTSSIDRQINMLQNMVREEYNGYLIYVCSSSNDEILNILKTKLSN